MLRAHKEQVMKYLFAAAILLLAVAETPAQSGEAKQVTVTSYVYANRFCARMPILGISMSKVFGADRGDEELPGPTGSCVEACKPDSERHLAVVSGENGFTYKAKDTAKLRDQCGKKVTVSGKASPSEKKDEFILEIESVKPYVEPEKKPLPESNVLDDEFGNRAVLLKVFITSLYNRDGKFTVAKIDEQKADAKRVIRSTADQKMWDLLLSYGYHVRRFLFLGSTPEGDGKKTAAEMQPMLEKCGDYAADHLNARKAPAVTECTKIP